VFEKDLTYEILVMQKLMTCCLVYMLYYN